MQIRQRFLAMQAVPPPLRARRVAYGMAWSFFVASVVLALAPWIQNIQGSGRVIAFTPLERQQVLEAPISGQVDRWHVQEGDRVEAGDLLVELVDNDPRLVERLEAERQALRSKLQSYEERAKTLGDFINSVTDAQAGKVGSVEAKVRSAQQKIEVDIQDLESAKAAEQTARLNLERVRALFSSGLVSKRDLELAELEVRKTETNRAGAQAALQQARQELESAQSGLLEARSSGTAYVEEARAKQSSAEADAATVRGSLQKIDADLSRQEMRKVKAPRAGTILRILAYQGGEQVKPGDDLLVLVPDSTQRAIEIWVDGNDAALIGPDRPVRIQFEGWPAVQFSGWPSVAVGTFGGRVSFVDSLDNGQGDFRLVVVPDPSEEPWPEARFLRQGVRANAWVLLDQVPLGFELWRRFNGFPPTVAAPATGGSGKVDTKGGAK